MSDFGTDAENIAVTLTARGFFHLAEAEPVAKAVGDGYFEQPEGEVSQEFKPLSAEMKLALFGDMQNAANQIVDNLEDIPVLQRGDWMALQMKRYIDSIKQMGVDDTLIAYHLGMLVGMQMESTEHE